MSSAKKLSLSLAAVLITTGFLAPTLALADQCSTQAAPSPVAMPYPSGGSGEESNLWMALVGLFFSVL